MDSITFNLLMGIIGASIITTGIIGDWRRNKRLDAELQKDIARRIAEKLKDSRSNNSQ